MRYWISELRGKFNRLLRRLKLAFGCYDDFSFQVHTFYGDNLRKGVCDTTMVYVGDLDMTTYLLEHGVREFYKTDEKHCVASIGFNPKKESWFGWSHRASCEFYVGKKICYGDIGYEEFYKYVYGSELEILTDRSQAFIEFEIQNIADARKMAEIFANDVS